MPLNEPSLIQVAASELLLAEHDISQIAHKASFNYRRYSVDKRNGSGKRWIHQPAPSLKAIQRWISRRVLSILPIHPSAYAYRQDYSIKKHAEAHCRNAYILRLDIKEFFPSIRNNDVRLFLKRSENLLRKVHLFSDEDYNFIILCLCRFTRVAIGAPSSPMLTNVICYHLDEKLHDLAVKSGLVYTRYADDLYFSTSSPNLLSKIPIAVATILRELDCPAHLHLNHRKTCHSSKKRRRKVTGVILTPDGQLSVGRELKRRIRAMVHQVDHLDNKNRLQLAGLLGYCQGIEASFVNRLYV
ncbi:MAG: retron St85 family RNA-directed DNA polymerase, partial [Deltaproteobacteria bacterium]|nr:retron St85 family RNA-directed DNA polymerase [Deltaproteobacteria bacterium]